MEKYIFYDFETTGKGKKASPKAWGQSPNWEQILQVGAIVANSDFKSTNKSINEFCRLRSSIIPQPGALLTTKQGIKKSLQAKYSSYQLISLINKTFKEWKDEEEGNSIFIGHNSIEFDESVLEYNLLNHLYYPYITRPNRADTLNLSRGLYCLNPTSLKIGTNQKGSQIFRLETLADLNGLPVESAHDALSDVRTTISLAKFIKDSDPETWEQLKSTMNGDENNSYVNKYKGFCHINYWFGKIQVQALSMVCESKYKGWYHTIDLKHDPKPLLESNIEEFKKLIKGKNRYVICNKNPILFSGKLAINYPPYDELGRNVLNERADIVFKNKVLADKFKHMELDKELEKTETASQDNIFPESQANLFLNFGQLDVINEFHEQSSWKEKYRVALKLKDPRASFIAKRLIFDECPEILTEDDFRFLHRELHDRLVINQHRPFTTIPEAMNYIDTELSKIEENDIENKDEKMEIIKDYNKYLIFI